MSHVRRLRLAVSVHGPRQAPAYVGVLIKSNANRTALKNAADGDRNCFFSCSVINL